MTITDEVRIAASEFAVCVVIFSISLVKFSKLLVAKNAVMSA